MEADILIGFFGILNWLEAYVHRHVLVAPPSALVEKLKPQVLRKVSSNDAFCV